MRELVESALGAVLYAPEDAYDLVLDQGASALSEPAARWARTGRTVLVVTGALLARLWRAGWQPADLARAVRRELTPRHQRLAVDLIAAEARGYAAAALDPRWAGQLRELEASPWWGEDDGFLPGVAARERADRFAVATLLLELFRLIGRLPPITLLAPPPGAAGDRGLSGRLPSGGGEPRMLGRIRALLAKAESTDFPEEAEALTAKAQQLMAQHSIDEALLAAGSGGGSDPGACRIGIDNPYEAPKAVLLDAVADANRARSVWSKDLGFCTVVGFPADLEAVELLYTSLLVQATSAMNGAGARRAAGRGGSEERVTAGRGPAARGGGPAADGGARTKSFRQSFLVAYAARIRERLAEATAQATEEALAGERAGERSGGPADSEPALLPVLAAREEAVRETTDRMFPTLRAGRAVRANDYEGWTQGRAAADRARLHGHSEALPH
ncbi:DUF2786 domain-containing protein [Streptacidiphilus sp. P02-A3a]|uniref:DUF2786 domain-containing protein n=1 Tax=Streptacidiphilus sp. P02-A3a TaxID=2704468 RepID=UPI001CDB768C|nr:DUF2786 domain-containing protein [Streptacidiphilus sp. P02-A3a]